MSCIAPTVAVATCQPPTPAVATCLVASLILYDSLAVSSTNICPEGFAGDPIVVSKPAGFSVSLISVEDATATAQAIADAEAAALRVLTPCQEIYESLEVTATDTCPEGFSGDPIVVTKPAGFSTSLISVADATATAQAIADAEAAALRALTPCVEDPPACIYTDVDNPILVANFDELINNFENGNTVVRADAGTYQRFTDTIPADMFGIHRYYFWDGFTYDPSACGAAVSISYGLRARIVSLSAGSLDTLRFYPLARQGGKIFIHQLNTSFLNSITALFQDKSIVAPGTTSSDWLRFEITQATPGGPDLMDWSATGGPIEFGIFMDYGWNMELSNVDLVFDVERFGITIGL